MTQQVRGSAELQRVRGLAGALDTVFRIPGTSIRFGLDAPIGLVPGIGDVAAAGMSGYIILVAAKLGAPAPVLMRMLLNVGIDTVIGAIPLAGDVFDAAWRANTRNAALLERHLAAPVSARRASRGVLAGVVVMLLLLLAGAVAASVLLVRLLLGLVT